MSVQLFIQLLNIFIEINVTGKNITANYSSNFNPNWGSILILTCTNLQGDILC